jgi:hypothetical protein
MLNYHFRDVPSRIGDGVLAALLRKISVEKHIFYTPLASFSKNFLVHVFHVPFKGDKNLKQARISQRCDSLQQDKKQ